MTVINQNKQNLKYLNLLLPLLLSLTANAEQTGITSESFSEISCEQLKTALSKQGWRGELTSQGDILLWPPGNRRQSTEEKIAKETTTSTAAEIPVLKALRETLETRGWRMERSKNGEVKLWPPESNFLAKSSGTESSEINTFSTTSTDHPDFEEMRTTLESRRWYVETDTSGNLLLHPNDSPNQGSATSTASTATISPTTSTKISFPDSDGDSVPDEVDICPRSNPGTSITKTGCEATETIVLEGVNFLSGSAELTDSARLLLDQIASRLIHHPDLGFKVVGHTDSVGRSKPNLKLSKHRAVSVANYLSTKKINPQNMSPVGKGETKPVSSNKTKQGRAKNRRVELQLEE